MYYQSGTMPSSQPRGSKKTGIKQSAGHQKQLASSNWAARGNQSSKSGNQGPNANYHASAMVTSSANQRKNRNLYTSIGNYNSSSTKFKQNATNPGAVNTSTNASAQHSSLVALNQQLGQHYTNQQMDINNTQMAQRGTLTQSGTRFQSRLHNNFMIEPHAQEQQHHIGFDRMNAAAINSASAHRQGGAASKKQSQEGRKSVAQRAAAQGHM